MAGFVLSLLGGLFIVASGVFNLQYSIGYPYMGYAPYQWNGVLGLISGAGVILGSLLLYWVPQQRVGWGVMILVFAVSGLFSASGAAYLLFLPGVALALVGGSLAILWRSSTTLGLEDYRTCLNCGRHVLAEYPMCPYCGSRAPGGSTSPPPP